LSKDAIYAYLADIRNQAIDAIAKRCNERISLCQREKAIELGLNDLVTKASKAGKQLLNIQNELATAIGLDPKDYGARTLLVRSAPNTERDEILNSIFQHIEDKEIEKLREERRTKLDETRTAYNKITETVKQMRSEKKILEYLKSLGFKIEEIPKYEKEKNKVKPTKDVLFPCLAKE